MSKPLKGFITYSHEDTEAKDELRKRLAVMERGKELVAWDDGQLTPGDGALQEDILKNVVDSDILLYLVSAASLASENCNKELAEAIEGDKRVIPIILEDCDWLKHQLSGFEVLPHKGKPLNEWIPESKGWQNVVDGIRKAVADLTTAKDMDNERKVPEDIASPPPPTNPSSKSAKYQCYFQKLIDELREEHGFTRARVGQPVNWYSFSSGIRGISYRVKFVDEDTEFAQKDTVRTYVNIHDDVRANRFDLFDALEQRKEQIEAAFGSPLVWECLPEQKRSRIVVSRDGNIGLPCDELEGIRAWHIANLLKLKAVFQPEIERALETLT